jgi:gas vesicle protein
MTGKDQNKGKKKMSPLAAGAIGASIGALAGAAAVALSDEKTRKKIGKKITELEEKAKEITAETEQTVRKLEGEARKRLVAKGKKK